MSIQRYAKYKDSGVEWLGEVPEHWGIHSFRHCLSQLFNGLTATQIEEGETTVPVTRIETISSGVIDEARLGFISSADAREDRLLVEGDILFSNINSLSMIGNCAHYQGGRSIYAGMNLLVFRPTIKTVPRWLYWLVRSTLFRSVVESLAKPAINQASVSQSSLNSITVAVPSIAEQITIASFLDRETAKIDALVAEQRRLMELLKEKRQTVISHAVTKGLNPNAPMKPSGLGWPTEVPAHWEVLPLTRVVRQFVDYRGVTPTKLDEGTVPLITATQIKNGRIDHALDPVFISEDEYQARMTRGFPEKGDVLLTTEAPLGEVAQIEDERVSPGQRIILMKPELSKITKAFLYTHFRSQFGQKELWLRASGSTASGIRADRLRASAVLVPPLEEQNEIFRFVEEEISHFPPIEAALRSQIDLLQERRTALISAAVTGQIDVQGLVEAGAA